MTVRDEQVRATRILNGLEEDPKLASELMTILYDELRKLATARMAREASGQTLQATALVHEAYLRLVDKDECKNEWASRAHFFKSAAETMRRILIDRARRKQRVRHGGDLKREDVDHIELPSSAREEQLLAIDEALGVFEGENPRKAEVVKLKYFVGLSNIEAAEMLGVSLATLERDWAFAKAWLFRWLKTNG